MKKLMTVMLGLSLALGAVSISFAADAEAPPKKEAKKGKKGKKGDKKGEGDTKKEEKK